MTTVLRASLVGFAIAAFPASWDACIAEGPAPEPAHVTVKDRVMCGSQRSLREALRAIEYKDSAALHLLRDCHYSVDQVPALVLQDNISAIKVRLFGENDRIVEYWTLPDTVKPAGKR
jgi:hypothetical protein